MKKSKIFLFIFMMLLAVVFTFQTSNAEPVDIVTVNVHSYFAADNIIDSTSDVIYGMNFAFDGSLATNEQYTFAFWIQNGVVKDVPVTHEFIVTKTTDLTAIFRPNEQFAVIFMDANGKVLNTQFVEPNGVANDVGITIPAKPGYVPTVQKWDKPITTPITDDTIFSVEYVRDVTVSTHKLTVLNGQITDSINVSGVYNFNEKATVEAMADPESGPYFNHWEINNTIVSNQRNYTFTILQDTLITAIYSDTPATDAPLVSLSAPLQLVADNVTYLGQFYLPTDYTLIEYGMLTSAITEELDLSTADVNRVEGRSYVNSTKEWMMSFPISTTESVRAYIVYKDSLGNLMNAYNEVSIQESDLFFSEYGEGTSNNKWIEIYNPTESVIDLSSYSIILYSNGSKTPTATQTFVSGTILESGEVFVLYNSSAIQVIKDLGDISSSVANFSGDDALGLYKNGVLIDQFGVIGVDPGTEWVVGSSDSTVDHTLVRTVGITSPNTSWDANEWDAYSVDTFTYIGWHTMELATSVVISGSTNAITQEEAVQLSAIVDPIFASQKVNWTSSNNDIAVVDPDGLVTGVTPGIVTITATSALDPSIYDTYEITVSAATYYSIDLTFDSAQGAVEIAPESSVIQGGSVTFTVSTNIGFDIGTVNINDEEVFLDENGSYTYTNVQENLSIEVLFVAKAELTEQIIYTTGFNTTDGFTTTTIYNNLSPRFFGPTDYQWSFVYGTPSTTNLIEGTASAQMRYYTSAPTTYGYAATNFTLSNVTKVTFQAKNTSNIGLIVYYYSDDNTITGNQTFTLTSTAATYTFDINATGNIHLKFGLVADGSADKAQLIIDDVKVYGLK